MAAPSHSHSHSDRPDAPERTPLLTGERSHTKVTETVADALLKRGTPRSLWIVLGLSLLLVVGLLYAVTYLLVKGVGIWGINIPVGWGFAIVNFVWWIGIGHAGTFISAVLLLMLQPWRRSINRLAETMTLFAVVCAGLFPLLHLGRPWVFYWMLPYPDTLNLWPQFRSPLVWDIFAVLTYGTVSLVFWYIGLIPDLATIRDRLAPTKPWKARIYGVLALGWRGSAKHWQRHQTAYLLLAGLATPLVVSVHSIVGLDFAVSLLPGWHSTIFPPYFVAGAIFSGFAMVLTLVVPLRRLFGLKDLITARHLDLMAKVTLATGLIVAYGYLDEAFFAFYSGEEAHRYMMLNRAVGPYAPLYWTLVACNVVFPQALWSRRVRSSPIALFVLSLVINLGMWLERFIIVVTSLHRDFLVSSWDMYVPSLWDWVTLAGTIGLFFALIVVFLRALPMVSMAETRETVHDLHAEERDAADDDADGGGAP